MVRVIIHPRKKQKVFERDNFTCKNCGDTGDFKCMEVDHIIPVVEGGSNDLHNLQTLCFECNMKKRHNKIFDEKARKEYEELNNKTPLEKLELIKEEAEKYSHLTRREFRLIFNQVPLFRFLNISMGTVEGYIFTKDKKTLGKRENKYKILFAKVIAYMKSEKGVNQREIAKIIGMSQTRLSKVITWAKEKGHIIDKDKKEIGPMEI